MYLTKISSRSPCKFPLEQFEKIEEILENYGLAEFIEKTEGDGRLSREQALKYYSFLTTQLQAMANDPSIQSEIQQVER